MAYNRRNWLKHAGLAIAALGLAPLEALATPASEKQPSNLGISKSPIRLCYNENPYGPCQAARTAMADMVGSSNHYQWEMYNDLKAAIAAKNGLAKENVLIGAGSTQMIDTVVQLAALQRGSVMYADPTFSRWKDSAEKMGMQKIAVPLTKSKHHDLPAMLATIRPDTRMIYVCNPNNPTGTVCNSDTLRTFVKEAAKKCLVLADEAYLDYTEEPSLSNLVNELENLIVVKTFSKIYGLAGARIGYALSHPKTIERMDGLQSGANIGVSAVSLAGALASLKEQRFVEDTYQQNETARSYTVAHLERMNLKCISSHTNFIYFSLANYKKDFFALLKAHDILGTGILEEDGKWTRITVGTMDEMRRFVEAVG